MLDKKINTITKAGLVLVFVAFVYTVWGYIDISSDPSTRGFAFLIFIEGGFFILVGAIVALVGWKRRDS